jgi:DNA polymerase V
MPELQPIFTAADLDEDRSGQPQLCPLPAGWPSPAETYVEDSLDLHKLAVRNPPATFFLRVTGDSMLGAGIHNGDLLVVDRSHTPASGKVVVAVVDGELTIKRLVRRRGRMYLCPENPAYPEIDITDQEETRIWGVATYVLHQL